VGWLGRRHVGVLLAVALGALGLYQGALLDGLDHGLPAKFLHPAVALVMAALFVRALTTDRMAFLRHPGLRLAGLVSYGVYLFHWPVLEGGLGAAGIEAGAVTSPVLAVIVVLGLSLVAFVVGTVSYVLVERPFLQIGRRPAADPPVPGVIDLREGVDADANDGDVAVADDTRTRVAVA
jgi:peptidoglycan/LPS O-acetylase OafA/YrhL